MTAQRAIIALVAFIIACALILVFWPEDPRAQFAADMRRGVEMANQREHLELKQYISPSLKKRIESQGLPLAGVVLKVQKHDVRTEASYTFADIVKFNEGEYAEAQFTRQEANGDPQAFALPFIYVDETWKIAPEFEDGRSNFQRMPFAP